MKTIKYLLFSGILCTSIVSAQSQQKAISDFQTLTHAKVSMSLNAGIPEFIKFPFNQPLQIEGATIQSKALQFLTSHKDIFNINEDENAFELITSKTDSYGLKHVVLNQNYKGVPVFDGKLHFNFNSQEKLTSVNGNYIPFIKVNETPSISKALANSKAIQIIQNQNINHSGVALEAHQSDLYIFQKGLIQDFAGPIHLVYEVEVRNNVDVREYIYIDAHTGDLVEQFTGMAHALDRIVYEDNTSDIAWQEGDAFPGSLTIWQRNEVEASAHMYNFFNNAFGYVSYDGADAQMRTINNNPNISCPNANWNGSTANYCDGTASDDVIAHEWGHAYTEYTSGLIYQFQSGAINESYSDIWGETIDLLNGYEDADDDNSLRTPGCGSSDRWRIGEDASAFGNPIRDMWNPPCNGDPGKLSDGQYSCGNFDSGGVHINSGIPNHAYALLVDGGTYNGQTINALGFTKAAHIFWRAQSQYLTATSDFEDLANALNASANDLLGINLEGLSTAAPVGPSGEIITTSDLDQLTSALIAVELINPNNCGYTPILAPLVDDVCDASTSNPIYVEDWESGMGSWIVGQLPVNSDTWEDRDWEITNVLPDGRVGNAIFGPDPINGNCSSDLENGRIRLVSPVITMPDFTDGTFDMYFEHYIATEPNWDGANIKYRLDTGAWTLLPGSAFTENPYNGVINTAGAGNDNPMEGQEAFTGVDEGSNSGSWGASIINLSSLGVTANSNIQFRFEMGTDGCNGRDGWYIDNITIYNCTEPLSVSEFNLETQLSVYPNPSTGIFTIQKKFSVDLEKAEIHDMNGRLIKTINLSSMQTTMPIDLSKVSSGMYFMSLVTQNEKVVIKLIKE